MSAREVNGIGVGMLGYAFMGKAHSNGFRKLDYMTWPPPLRPRLVAIAGRNDLEAPAYAIAPEIARVRALLDAAPGVLLARMSGSGATCFALFDSIAARNSAATDAAAQGWWTLACTLR